MSDFRNVKILFCIKNSYWNDFILLYKRFTIRKDSRNKQQGDMVHELFLFFENNRQVPRIFSMFDCFDLFRSSKVDFLDCITAIVIIKYFHMIRFC